MPLNCSAGRTQQSVPVAGEVSREGVRRIIESALDPLCSEIIGHDPVPESLEVGIFDLI